MKKNPRVAVLLCTYNPSDSILLQVDTILKQVECDVHITIFDDASTTGLSYLEQLAQDPNVEFRSCSSSGSAGKNFMRAIQCFDATGYDYISFADQDDVWCYEKLSRAISEIPEDGAYSSDLLLLKNGKLHGLLRKPGQQNDKDFFFHGASAGCTYILTQSAYTVCQSQLKSLQIDQIGNLVSHDWMIYFLCRVNKIPWTHDAYALIYYRQHEGNVYGRKNRIYDFIKKAQFVFQGLLRENYAMISLVCEINGHSNEFAKLTTDPRYFLTHFWKLRRDSKLLSSIVATHLLFLRKDFPKGHLYKLP